MDKRFFRLFDMSEEEAIALLDKPIDQLDDDDSRYVAASHLVNYSSEKSIAALLRAVRNPHPSLDNQITRRKAIESLGRLNEPSALPAIAACLNEADRYLVENAVWAIGEIGTDDAETLEAIAQLLDRPGRSYRVIIQVLAKLGYKPAVDRIRRFINPAPELEPPIYSAAIAAVARLSGEYDQIDRVVALLSHENVSARRSSMQDLIDANYVAAIPTIARCPVSLVFRFRAIRLLADAAINAGTLSFEQLQPSLEQVVRDSPNAIELVHEYDRPPALEFLIRELYNTDFGRCYLATKTLVEAYPDRAPEALLRTYQDEACSDYGAHYHVIKTLGWLKHRPAYDLIVESLHNRQPQFQKSRAAAAIALGELGDVRAIPELHTCLDSKVWSLKYAALMALDQFGDRTGREQLADDPDRLIRARAAAVGHSSAPTS